LSARSALRASLVSISAFSLPLGSRPVTFLETALWQ
jgi:hypothetical protein